MPLFRELTEEEKEQKELIKIIRYSNLSESLKIYWISYVNGVYSGQKINAFFEREYLIRAIMEVVSAEDNDYDYDYYLKATDKWLKALLPSGKSDPQYKPVMEMFINNFMKLINADMRDYLLDSCFIALFDSKTDALDIILNLGNKSRESVEKIIKYAIEVSPYCTSQDNFKKELLSFIDEFGRVVEDEDGFYLQRLNEAKKRVGVYPIDEKTLAFISAEAEKAQRLLNKLSNMQNRVNSYEQRIKGLTEAGKKEILELRTSTVEEIQTFIRNYKATIENELNEYLLGLEQALKNSSDAVFNKLLEEAQAKIREVKLTISTLSQSTTNELLRIKSASEESVDRLKSFVDNNDSLKELLKEAQADADVRQAILKMQEGTAAVVSSQSSIVIPGYDRPVVPASPEVIIPEKGIVTSIIPAFDERIPFSERIGIILDKKHMREAKGEIFHEQTEHVIRCILEGDWPYLWGPSGCGKSYTVSQIAELIGIDLIDNGKITDKYSLMAYNDPHGRFRATQAFVAFTYGKCLFLDELDNGNVDTEVLLNPLYSALIDVLGNPNKKKYVTFAEDMRVPVNPNFRMIAAGNTSGGGETEAFSSRGKIDESVQQRMTPIFFNYDNRVEQIIFGDNTQWYDFFIKFRAACDEYAKRENLDTATGIGTTRDASSIVRYIKDDSKTIDQVLYDKFIQTKSAEYLSILVRYFEEAYGVDEGYDYEYDGALKDATAKLLAGRFTKLARRKMNRD